MDFIKKLLEQDVGPGGVVGNAAPGITGSEIQTQQQGHELDPKEMGAQAKPKKVKGGPYPSEPVRKFRPLVGDIVTVYRQGVKVVTILTAINKNVGLLKTAKTLRPYGKIDLTKLKGGENHPKYTRGQMLKFLKLEAPANPEQADEHVKVFTTEQ